MRMPLMIPVLLLAAGTAAAGGRSAGEVCVGAGFRVGTAAFTSCIARVEGDDPLAALLPAAEGKPAAREETPAVEPGTTEPRVVAGVKIPGSEAKASVVGTMVVNGELVTAAPPAAPVSLPAAAPPPLPVPQAASGGAVQLPAGVTLTAPTMPSFSAPNWVWSGGSPQ
ncbi:MAG: hypothetical protein ACM31L_10225 [Actinomycetota bacterium]